MRLYVIVVKDKNDETPWVVNAWDEYSVDENYQGFDEEVEKAKRAHKDGEVCVGSIRLPGNVLDSLFVPGVRASSPGRLSSGLRGSVVWRLTIPPRDQARQTSVP